MTIKKRARLRLKIIFFLTYILVLALFVFGLFRFLRSFFDNYQVINPLSQNSGVVCGGKTFAKVYNDLEQSLKENRIDFVSISKYGDSAYLVRIAKDKEVIFSQKLQASRQVSSLQLIQSRLTIEGKDFKRLDFRFSNPIAVLK